MARHIYIYDQIALHLRQNKCTHPFRFYTGNFTTDLNRSSQFGALQIRIFNQKSHLTEFSSGDFECFNHILVHSKKGFKLLT